MTGFIPRQPFHPASDFVAVRGFTLNSVELKEGDPVDTTGVEERVLRALYDQRKIDYPAIKPVKAQSQATLEAKLEATLEGTLQATLEPTLEGTPASGEDTAKPKGHVSGLKKKDGHSIKRAGFGGWKVIDPKGAPVGPGYKTEAEAQARADELNAK